MKNIGRIVPLIIVLAIVVTGTPFVTSATTNGITQEGAVAWMQSRLGHSLDYDGEHDEQCVDLIMYYYKFLVGYNVGGNAKDYATNSLPSGWSRIQYYKGFVPQAGDVVIWTSGGGGYGHVALIVAANEWTMDIIEQNYNYQPFCTKREGVWYTDIWGVIRPDFNSNNWIPASISTGNYYLKNKSTGTYLTVSGYADTNERNVVVESLNSNTTNRKAQAMAISKVSSGYKLRPQICSSRLINANAWQIVSGINVNIFDDVADSTQYWYFEAVSGGGYIIRNAQNTSCVLNAESSGNVNVATYNGGNSQIWYLESADHTHSYSSSVTKSPTCTESGTKKYTCSCGSSYTETIAALGHSYTNYTYNNNATCTADGTKTAYCNNGCGMSNTIAETGTQTAHQYSSSVIKPASCTETGIREYTCTFCSSSYTETISMGMHWWSEWRVVKQPTYNEYGIKACSCLNCGTEKTENINKLEHPFTDVKEGKWYTDAVVWCFKNGYMAGVSGTVFGYKENVTRGMFATILAKIDGATIIMNAYPTMSFNDVVSGKWYSDSIEWAYRNGYAAGIGNNKFGYKDPVTREQIALFFYTYSSKKGYNVANKADLSVFSDFQSVHVWAIDAVEWAVANGIITGTSSAKLAPRTSASRVEIAVIVRKYVETIMK